MSKDAANIVEIVESFKRHVGAGRHEVTQRRYQRVFEHLHDYLDSGDADFWLGTEATGLLACEREFEPHRALARMYSIDELVCTLPGFVAPAWLMPKPGDARSQVSLIDRLVRTGLVRGLMDEGILNCAVHDCHRAIRDARAELVMRSRTRRPL